MKIYLGTDHAGFELKEKLKTFLQEKGYEVEDCGAYSFDKEDDYPDFIGKTAEKVSQSPNDFGIVIGGSGQGEAMVANKYNNVRCALFYCPAVPPSSIDASGKQSTDPYEMLALTRAHNNSNMLSLGARFLTEEQAKEAVLRFLSASFSKEPRHQRRIDKIKKIEESR